jgi:hypothetical protein
MRAYVQLSIGIFARGELFFSDQLYQHFVHLWLFYVKYVATHGLTDSECEQAQTDAQILILEGQRIAKEVWDRPNGHGFMEFVQRLPWIRNAFLIAAGPFERRHQIASYVNTGARQIESTIVKYYTQQEGMRHLLSGGIVYENAAAPKTILNIAKQHHVALTGLTYKHLTQDHGDYETRFVRFQKDFGLIEYRGEWIPSRRGMQSVVWSDDDRQGIQGWLNTNQIQADIEQGGFTCTRMTWLDRNVNK